MTTSPLIIRVLGIQPYEVVWQAMQHFTQTRSVDTLDEIWFVQHPPVFTQGQAGKPEHVLKPGHIPIVQTDRGGQVTYHGPGQLIAYTLLDLRRLHLNIRQLVTHLEQSVIDVLKHFTIEAKARCDAPGVYVEESKIASVGLRVKQGCCYHGVAFNIKMDLEPFSRINPCGYAKLPMTQVSELNPAASLDEIQTIWCTHLQANLGYGSMTYLTDLDRDKG